MGLCRKSAFPRRLCLTASLVVHILCVCLYEAQCASVPSVYNRSPFSSHRRYDQTSLPIPREQFTNAFKESVGDVRSSLKTQADNFDEFFRDLLKVSHHNFHKMFLDTYGILYDRHSSIFNDMFRDLELYYTSGSVDLTVAMKQFFSLLYKKMFEELNSQYEFDSNYLNCTVEHMEEMMPFGELPQKLILQIKRSFIAIRTFVQALNYGNEVLKTIMEVPLGSSCESRLRAISYCRNCAPAGTTTPLVCQETCATLVDKSCLPYSASLNREWNLYVSDIAKLASRLKTSFNIELAVKPINIQISEAIMTFQENGPTISQRLFTKCGKPAYKRSPRDVYTYGNRRVPTKPISVYSTSSPHGAESSRAESMEDLISDILKDLKNFKNFWSQLSRNLCSQYSNSQSNCSTQISRSNEPQSYRDKNSAEIINQQMSTLKLISTNVNNAYNGLDVDLENNLKQIESGIGSTPADDDVTSSGEGDDDDDKDGDPNGDGELSGSGEEPITDPSASEPRTVEPVSSSTSNGFFFTSTPAPTPTTTAPDQRRQPSAGSRPTAAPWPMPLLVCAFAFLCRFVVL